MRPRVLLRLLQIQRALVRHGLDDFVRATHLYRPFRFLVYLSPWTWFQRSRRRARAANGCAWRSRSWDRFSSSSARRSRPGATCCPPTLPTSWPSSRTACRPSTGRSPSRIDRGRVCAAHRRYFRQLRGRAAGRGIHRAGARRRARRTAAKWWSRYCVPACARSSTSTSKCWTLSPRSPIEYWGEARRLRPIELVREYRKTILDELDLLREAGNAAQLKRNFAGSPLLYVPEVYWDYCRVNVMVMERIHGIIVNDVEELRARGADIAKLAENGVEIFFTQVFRDNFFHADMHPGNIFVQTDDPANPRYAAVDFGIVGTLQARDQHYLAENFLAFFDRDYARVAALHVESGWVPRGTRVDELESAVRTVCEPIFNKPLEGNLLRAGAAAPVRDGAPLRHAGAAAADSAAKDPVQHRGPRPPAVSRARPVEDGAAVPAPVDARAHQPPSRAAASARAIARCAAGAADAAADLPDRRARSGRRPPRRPAAPARTCVPSCAAAMHGAMRPWQPRCSGLRVDLAGSSRPAIAWLGWLQMVAAILIFVGSRPPPAARPMRIPIESSTSYRGRHSRPNWLVLAAFVGAALAAGAVGALFSPGASAAARHWYAGRWRSPDGRRRTVGSARYGPCCTC